MPEARQVRMINSVGTLRSMRRFGVTFQDGLGELIDNAVDAGSRHIAIRVAYEDGFLTMVLADDGVGIPEAVPGRPDIAATVQHVLRYGGKITHVNGNPFPIGKFGYGLSQTATCLTQRTTVHSRVADGRWRSCYSDWEDLQVHGAKLPPEQVDDAPNTTLLPEAMHDLAHGTVVVMEGIPAPVTDYEKEEHLLNKLERDLGRIYRHPLASSLRISLGTLDGDFERDVMVRDPLGRMPDSYEVNLYGGPMTDVRTVTLIFDGVDVPTFPLIEDPVTGQPAVVQVEMVNFDIARVYAALGVPAGATINGVSVPSRKAKGKLGKAGFNLSQQGFSVVRNGREIRNGQDLGLFTKHPALNYLRGQVAFPTCLDHLFNVQVVKGRYRLHPDLTNVLRERCRSTISAIRTSTRSATSNLNARGHVADTPDAETRSTNLRGLFPRPKPAPGKHAKQKKDLEAAKQQRIDEVVKQETKSVEDAKQTLENARLMNQPSAIKAAEQVLENALEHKEERVRAVRNRFANDAFIRKFVEPVPGGDLYALRDFHDEIWVVINSDSDFFRTLYQRSTAYAERQALLDLMLFAIAHAEATKANTEGMRAFWSETRRKISRFSHLFVSVFEEEEEAPVDLEAEMAKEEAYERDPQTSLGAWGVE